MESLDLLFKASKCLGDIRVEDQNRHIRKLEQTIKEQKPTQKYIYQVEFLGTLELLEELQKSTSDIVANKQMHSLIHFKHTSFKDTGEFELELQSSYGATHYTVLYQTKEESARLVQLILDYDQSSNNNLVYWHQSQTFAARDWAIIYNQPVPFHTLIKI